MPNIKLPLAIVIAVATQAQGQCPSTQVISSRPWERGSFGERVQIDGDVAVVADVNDQTFCLLCSSGAVHAFRRVDGVWRHDAKLFHSRISERDGFGFGLSLDGPARFAASAPGEGVLEPGAGAIYIFEDNGEAWHEVAEILPVEPQWANGFGGSLLLRGDTLIVGQPKFQTAEGFVGAAWVYRLVDGRWEFAQKLMAPDPWPNSKFADAMAMDGEWLAVGARLDEEGGHHAGAIYLYRRGSTGDFKFVRKLLAPGDPWNQLFGADVALQGDRLAIGAANGPGGQGYGAIYIYTLEAGQWTHIATLLHDDPGWGDALGASVALGGDAVIAGAPRHAIPGLTVGVAYAFERRADGSWRQTAKILPPGPSADFGRAVATDGASIIVGAPYEDAGSTLQGGAAHIFHLPCLLCRVDLDGDGELTFLDFLAFQTLFAAGDPAADFDGDGALTFFDFGAFQTEFAAGCA